MAFNVADIVYTGTYGNLSFYFWKGVYCVRTKSSLTGKRVRTSAVFRNTMQSAGRLSRASKTAAQVYRQLPDGWKLHSLYRKMTGIGIQLLKEREYSPEEIETILWQYLSSIGYNAELHKTAPIEKQKTDSKKHKVRKQSPRLQLRFTRLNSGRKISKALHSGTSYYQRLYSN